MAEHSLRNDPAEARQIETWIQSFAEVAQLSPTTRSAFDHAPVEWITNVIAYAYDDAREHWITIRFLITAGQARVEVEDDGREFNPLTLPPVKTNTPWKSAPLADLASTWFVSSWTRWRIAAKRAATFSL